jgi:hypothetical protein
VKQYDRFGEYMFDLLFAPLKKGKRAVNQFFIFFKVIGRVFDGLKEDALRVRDETNIATASPVMLPVHGQDRNMPRLAGESVEGYRTRLAMKGIIAEKGGLKDGILYALAALGYEQSTIEPFVFQDPERWAEFIVFLKGSQQSGVNDLNVIDAEVCKVKEGSSKPAYGSEAGAVIEIGSGLKTGYSHYPRCNEIVCGVWPHIASIGHLLKSEVTAQGGDDAGEVEFPKVGTIAASEKCYQPHAFAMYASFSSETEAGSEPGDGVLQYPICSPGLRCSEETYSTGGERDL